MNIESNTLKQQMTTNTDTKTTLVPESQSAQNISLNPTTNTSFKAELEAVKEGKAEKTNNDKSAKIGSEQLKTAKQLEIKNEKTQIIEEPVEVKTTLPNTSATNAIINNSAHVEKPAFKNTAKASNENKKGILEAANVKTEIPEIFELTAEIKNIKTAGLKNETRQFAVKMENEVNDKQSIQTIKFDTSDAQFFVNLINKDSLSVQQPNSNFSEIKSEATQQNVQVSSVLMDALSESMKTNKPFRIDFDNNISVILKVNKEGKLSAEFIPGDKAVENYLRNNIPLLQQSFNEQGLAYDQLNYRKHQNQQQQNNQNNKKNKENEDE